MEMGEIIDIPAHLTERLRILAPGGGRLLAAVSGGADSVALLRALIEAGVDVAVAHLDHALRPESAVDARFVADLAAELGVEYRLERVEVKSVADRRGWNLEDAARRVRYEFLTRSARELGARAVLTAHTLDDQAETVVMQLLRGAAYLRGMPVRRGNVVRPLLDLSRASLRLYLERLGQSWREDASNVDTSRLRAWLRNEMLPALEGRFPDVKARLARHGQLQLDIEEFVRWRAKRLMGDEGFDRRALAAEPEAVQREAIRLLFDTAGVAPDSARIELVRRRLALRNGPDAPYRLTLAPGLALRLAYGRLELARSLKPREERAITAPEELPPGVPAGVLQWPDLRLRGRRTGDRMRLSGGSKSLSRLLIDKKVPREERDSLAVLASGSRVLWVEGIGLAADVAGDHRASPGDGHFMRRALELAEAAARAGELPVGAVVVREGAIVGEGHNETESRRDPTAHAELLAMRRAAEETGDWRLAGCTLYVTLEPCPMCAGAAIESHMGRIVYGADNSRDGALGSVTDLLAAPWKRRVEVSGGVLATEAGRKLSSFFAGRRRGSS